MSTVLGPLRKVLRAASLESKSSLHKRELTNPSALLIQHAMCPRGADDVLCASGRCTNINSLRDRLQSNSSYDAGTPFTPIVSADFAPSPPLLSQAALYGASSKLVQLRVENGLGNEFPFLR